MPNYLTIHDPVSPDARVPTPISRMDCIGSALGLEPADVLFTNACLYDPFSCDWIETDIAMRRDGSWDAAKVTEGMPLTTFEGRE